MKKIINALDNAVSTIIMVIWLGIAVTGYIIMTAINKNQEAN